MPQGSNPNSLKGLKIGWESASLRRNPENTASCKVCGISFDKRGRKKRSHCSIKCKAKSQKKEGVLTKYEYNKVYYQKNYNKLLIQAKNYRDHHRNERNLYQKKKRQTDPVYRLNIYLRTRLCKAIKRGQKVGSAIRDLGCTITELKNRLELQFQPGMSWKNWSLTGWHIDHIIPLSLFDLTDIEQVKKACHYTNLQPLWATENIKKSNKYEIKTSV